MCGKGWGVKGYSALSGDSAVLERLVQARDGSEAIPPVVARIFSGDSTSPLTRDGHGCPKLNARVSQGCETNRAFIWQV